MHSNEKAIIVAPWTVWRQHELGCNLRGNEVIIVSGLPRSGTSMMMKMLQAGGLTLLTDNVRAADAQNPNGYYELEAVKELESNQQCLADASGKVVKVISQLLHHLPRRFDYRVIFMRRIMAEILRSQKVMLRRRKQPIDRIRDEELAVLFEQHLDQVEAWLARQTNFAVLPINYNSAMEAPIETSASVESFLEADLDLEAMGGVIDKSLHRQRAQTTE